MNAGPSGALSIESHARMKYLFCGKLPTRPLRDCDANTCSACDPLCLLAVLTWVLASGLLETLYPATTCQSGAPGDVPAATPSKPSQKNCPGQLSVLGAGFIGGIALAPPIPIAGAPALP